MPLRAAWISFSSRIALVAGALCVACANPEGTEASCADCRLEVERVVVLGEVDGPGALPGRVTAATRHSDGSILIGTSPGEAVLIFDTTGRHLGSIGRSGEGPGEFGGGIHGILPYRGDSLLVIDGGNDRLAAFSADWRTGWTAPDPSAYGGGSLVALAGEGFIRSGEVRGAEQQRRPLHLLGSTGQLVRSFGGTGEDLPFAALYPLLAPSADGAVWAAHPTRYRLELWSPEDSLLRAIERDTDWFPPRDNHEAVVPDRRPNTTVLSLHRDARGRLWIAARVGAEDWASGLGPETAGPHGPYHPVTDFEKVYDTMIEVLDETTGASLASIRIPQLVYWFLGDGLAAVAFEDELGVPRLELLRLRLIAG